MNNEIDTYTRRPANQDNKTQINKKVLQHNHPKQFGIQAAPGQLKGQPDNDCVDLHAKTGLVKDKISGTFQGEDIDISVKQPLNKRTISGSIKGSNFELRQDSNLTKINGLSGYIGENPICIKYIPIKGSYDLGLKGNIGDKKVNLAIKDIDEGKRLIGNFEGEKINLEIKNYQKCKTICGNYGNQNIDLKVKNLGMLSDNYDVKGKFNGSPDLLPLLFSSLYDIQNENEEDTAAALMFMNTNNQMLGLN